LVQLASRLPTNLIMEKLYQLKQTEAKYKAVIGAHDMTIKERGEVETLVDETKYKAVIVAHAMTIKERCEVDTGG